MQSNSSATKFLVIGTSLVLLFLISAVAACGSVSGGTHVPGTPAVTVRTASTQSVTPRISSGVQPCPGETADPAYWMRIIGTNIDNEHVESVSCANIMGAASLQALVTDRRSDAGHSLDVYVFNNINTTSPAQIFHIFGLVKGQAKISGYNTILTAQADELSSLNSGKPVSTMTADLFREFKWSASVNTLVQTVFPGIFPDLTRYQAETDQASVNQGHQPWKLSATMVAGSLASSLLTWSASSTTTLLSGGGAHDVSAVVRVRSAEIVSGTINVTLSRLEGNTNGGIWEVISVTANGMSLTSPVWHVVLSNPSSVKGTGNAFEGLIGQIMVLDHLYNTIGKTSAIGVVGNGPTSFSTNLSYQSTFPAGIQEGILVLYARSNANGSIAAAVMEKILVT
ncbi:MAG: hypothetical protein ACXWPS_11015 [Ktedonobacteraceae bacterium]